MGSAVRSLGHAAVARLDRFVGGGARRHVVIVFACVLALDSADKATIGADATQLQAALGIGKTGIGLLLAISSIVGALATLPFGLLVDRVRRTRLLAIAVGCWAVAMALSGAATSFEFLLFTRVLLGVVTAVAAPAIASLIGDYFPQHERGSVYGYVLSGELIGAGFGFLVAGNFASLSWRAPFLVLVLPTAGVLWLVWRLPEPARAGPSRMPRGAPQIRGADALRSGACEPYREPSSDEAEQPQTSLAQEVARGQSVEPHAGTVLHEDPTGMSLREAVGFVLRVRTNVVLIVASALGYFFFSGLRGFAIEFAKGHYDISQGVATSLTLVVGVGALAGVLTGGQLADHLLRRGRLAGRVEVAGVSVLLAGLIFIPALITTNLFLAVPLLALAALFLGAANPPLDAARLDIIHPRLWGRAEAVRTVLRDGADSAAPLLFGFFAGQVFGGPAATGLEYTFLLALVTLFVSSAIVLRIGRRTYPTDVATAARSVELTTS